MKVVIAEKPSVAREYARVLGATNRKDGYIEGDGYAVTWAIGHLVQLADAKVYGYEKWHIEDLPIIPSPFRLDITEDAGLKKQFHVIKDLFSQATEIIVGTDAGREGELIFRYIYTISGCKKPFKRLWISSQTDQAIRDGFQKLRPGTDYDNLYYAARCRSEADWLVGINATRALTLSARAKSVLSLGRVQTPVLAMICSRYVENINFKPEPFWELSITLEKDAKKFKAKHPITFLKAEDAEAAKAKVQNQAACTRAETKKVQEQPPLLFDLPSLQQETNKRFGFSAQKTLDVAQDLYEKHKLISYPRTGSRFLSEDIYPHISQLLQVVAQKSKFTPFANQLRLSTISKRPINNAKVTDHHALLPTETNPTTVSLSNDEEKVYDLIVMRFLAAFYPACEKEITQLDFDSGSLLFKASGSVILVQGWREIEEETKEEEETDEDNQKLPKVTQGDILPVTLPQVVKKMTKAKPILTEGSLLRLMGTAGKELEDDELRLAIKECGIGTPATRAAVIETLFQREYIKRDKKKLLPTEKGLQVFELVKDKPIASVSMTGKWEQALNLIAEGKRNYTQFIEAIQTYTTDTVQNLKDIGVTLQGDEKPKAVLVEVGMLDNEPVRAGKGAYGTYIIYQKQFYNIADKEPEQVTITIAQEAIAAKGKQEKKKAVQKEQNLLAKIGKKHELRNGLYGAYITDGKNNASIPKNVSVEDVKTWTEQQCKDHIKSYVAWKKKKEKEKSK